MPNTIATMSTVNVDCRTPSTEIAQTVADRLPSVVGRVVVIAPGALRAQAYRERQGDDIRRDINPVCPRETHGADDDAAECRTDDRAVPHDLVQHAGR